MDFGTHDSGSYLIPFLLCSQDEKCSWFNKNKIMNTGGQAGGPGILKRWAWAAVSSLSFLPSTLLHDSPSLWLVRWEEAWRRRQAGDQDGLERRGLYCPPLVIIFFYLSQCGWWAGWAGRQWEPLCFPLPSHVGMTPT